MKREDIRPFFKDLRRKNVYLQTRHVEEISTRLNFFSLFSKILRKPSVHSRLRDESLGFLLTLAATGKKVQVIQSSYIVFPLEMSLLQVFCNTTDVMVKARKFPLLQISKP